MTDLAKDSYVLSSLGSQTGKRTMPSYSVGTGTREAQLKIFHSKKADKADKARTSPGPVYNVPSSVGAGPSFGFGVGDQRGPASVDKYKYPETCIDLTCSHPDSQQFKYQSPPGVAMGMTEPRLSTKNAAVSLANPDAMYGQQSPGAEYHPKDDKPHWKKLPVPLIGPADDRAPRRYEERITYNQISSPRTLGPGSHKLPSCLGYQHHQPNPPIWSFGVVPSSQQPHSAREMRRGIETQPMSSIGKQVLSTCPNSPTRGFGKSSRDQVGRTAICITELDKTAAARMPRLQFPIDLPKPTSIPIVGV